LLVLAEVAARFWAKVDRSAGWGACWPWQGTADDDGYGQFWLEGKMRRATHVAWALLYGELPEPNVVACHACDNPCCVNPSPQHLFIGTQRDNIHDALRKDHLAYGERHGEAKLTSIQVAELRSRALAGESKKSLASAFGISVRYTYKLVNREYRRRDGLESTWLQ
jgi:hypothetical protein